MEAGRLREKAEVWHEVAVTTGGVTVLEWQKVGVIPVAVLGVTMQGESVDGVWVPSDTVRVMCRYTDWLYSGVRIVVFGVRYTVRSVEVDSRQRVMNVGGRRIANSEWRIANGE